MKCSFQKSVDRTFYAKGVKTISVALHKHLDKWFGNATSKDITIIVPNGNACDGWIYRYTGNKHDQYYQFCIKGDAKHVFQRMISIGKYLSYELDIDARTLCIVEQ